MNQPEPEARDTHDMARLIAGEEVALNALIERHGRPIFHFLLRALQNEEDADDLAQETFVRVYHHRHKFDPRKKFTTWLYTIATNLVRDRWRWRSRHREVSLEAESAGSELPVRDMVSSPEALPDQDLQRRERAEAVRRAVATLPEELRQPLILAVYEELPQAEIAEILGCSVKAVETRIYRARNQLRERLLL